MYRWVLQRELRSEYVNFGYVVKRICKLSVEFGLYEVCLETTNSVGFRGGRRKG